MSAEEGRYDRYTRRRCIPVAAVYRSRLSSRAQAGYGAFVSQELRRRKWMRERRGGRPNAVRNKRRIMRTIGSRKARN